MAKQTCLADKLLYLLMFQKKKKVQFQTKS